MSDSVTVEVDLETDKIDEGLEEIGLPKTDKNRKRFAMRYIGGIEMYFGGHGIFDMVVEDIDDLRNYADWQDFDHFDDEEGE